MKKISNLLSGLLLAVYFGCDFSASSSPDIEEETTFIKIDSIPSDVQIDSIILLVTHGNSTDTLLLTSQNGLSSELNWESSSNYLIEYVIFYNNIRLAEGVSRGRFNQTNYELVFNPKWNQDSVTKAMATALPFTKPIAVSDVYVTKEDDSIERGANNGILSNDSGRSIVVMKSILIDSTQSGLLSLNENGSFIYFPKENFFGKDSFTYQIRDIDELSNKATVVINVEAVNDAPRWKNQSVNLEIVEGDLIEFDLKSVFDGDPEGDSVNFFIKTGPGNLSSSGNFWSWIPNYSAGQSSPTTIVITARDDGQPPLTSDFQIILAIKDSSHVLITKVATGQGKISKTPDSFQLDPKSMVEIEAIPEEGFVFKNWTGDFKSNDPWKNKLEILMDSDKEIQAHFVKIEETVTLNVGESFVHGSIYHDGFIYLTTRTSPAKIIKVNSNDLSDYQTKSFPGGYFKPEQIVYSELTGKFYTSFFDLSRLTIAEIDPVTLEIIPEKIVDENYSTSGGSGHTLATDGDYLFATAYTPEGITIICKYSLTTFSNEAVSVVQMDSLYQNGHATEVQNGTLFISGSTNPPWVARISTSNMDVIQMKILRGGYGATDDLGITEKYLFVGTESQNDDFAGVIHRIDTDNLRNIFEISTGIPNGPCYGVTSAGESIWAIFGTFPGVLSKIDPVSLDVTNYQLDHNTPNEIIYDGKRLFFTFWDQDPGRIQAIHPSYLEDKVIP